MSFGSTATRPTEGHRTGRARARSAIVQLLLLEGDLDST